MTTFTYFTNQERPAIALEWLDRDGNVINFSSGYTFAAKLVDPATNTVTASEVSGVVGAAVSPNVVITWTDVNLSTFAAGTYQLQVYATTGAKDNVFAPDDPPLVRVRTAAA